MKDYESFALHGWTKALCKERQGTCGPTFYGETI